MRTCTVLIYYDGSTREARYSVMVGPMKGRAFNAHRADTVATYRLIDEKPDYAAMTAKHATAAAPAVPWQV